MRQERRDEHEIALRHLDIFAVVFAEINPGAAGQQIGAGFGLSVMVRQRPKAGRIGSLSEPEFRCRRMLRPDARDQFQSAGLGCVAVLKAFPGDQRPVVCAHLPELRLGRIGAALLAADWRPPTGFANAGISGMESNRAA
jgi:hypothetical protein